VRGESLRSIAFDFNRRGIKPAEGKKNGESGMLPQAEARFIASRDELTTRLHESPG
jgi:hypothetical protein